MNTQLKEADMNTELVNNAPSFFESVIEFKGHNNLSKCCGLIKSFSILLSDAKTKPNASLRIICKSSMLLLLLPALIAIKDRLRVEIQFEEETNTNFLDENISADKNRDFKELLETHSVLKNAGIEVMFSRRLNSI